MKFLIFVFIGSLCWAAPVKIPVAKKDMKLHFDVPNICKFKTEKLTKEQKKKIEATQKKFGCKK